MNPESARRRAGAAVPCCALFALAACSPDQDAATTAQPTLPAGEWILNGTWDHEDGGGATPEAAGGR